MIIACFAYLVFMSAAHDALGEMVEVPRLVAATESQVW